MLGATVTTQQARRARERDAYQQILRLLLPLDHELLKESIAKPGPTLPIHEAIELQLENEDDVDRLALMIRVHLVDVRRRKDRQWITTCTDVVYDRQQLDPNPVSIAQRAVSAIREIIESRVNKTRQPAWLGKRISGFELDLALLAESRKESFRAQQEWKQDTKAQTSGGPKELEPDDSGSSGNESHDSRGGSSE